MSESCPAKAHGIHRPDKAQLKLLRFLHCYRWGVACGVTSATHRCKAMDWGVSAHTREEAF